MRNTLVILIISIISAALVKSQKLDEFEVNTEWKEKIRSIAPESTAKVDKKTKTLLFSLHTGYYHWVIPHTDEVIKILAEKSCEFEVTATKDIAYFHKDSLAKYDVVILNNNCSDRARRDLFWDALGADTTLSDTLRSIKAAELENNLISFVKNGGGLVVLHGSIVMQNNSMEFSQMVGGSFDYHPPQQEIELTLVDSDHPMLKAFEGKNFVHTDEPYFFNNAYYEYNYRPLLSMNVNKLHSLKKEVKDTIKYVSWIKRYGQGRVFFVSPSHNAQSFEDVRMLRFYLDGMRYAAGKIDCDDSPMKKPE
jgi:type 1 glutamine amidotransferase